MGANRKRKAKAVTVSIEDLKTAGSPNHGTARGQELLERSIREHGAGRGIVVDKNGVVICGSKVLEAAKAVGIKRVRVVESDGEKAVVVRRQDLSMADGGKAAELAILDNRVGEVNLFWDASMLAAYGKEVDLVTLGLSGYAYRDEGQGAPTPDERKAERSGSEMVVGELRMKITAEAWDAWHSRLVSEVGVKRTRVEAEIASRMGVRKEAL